MPVKESPIARNIKMVHSHRRNHLAAPHYKGEILHKMVASGLGMSEEMALQYCDLDDYCTRHGEFLHTISVIHAEELIGIGRGLNCTEPTVSTFHNHITRSNDYRFAPITSEWMMSDKLCDQFKQEGAWKYVWKELRIGNQADVDIVCENEDTVMMIEVKFHDDIYHIRQAVGQILYYKYVYENIYNPRKDITVLPCIAIYGKSPEVMRGFVLSHGIRLIEMAE